MPDQVKILWKMDAAVIRWQYCAICGAQAQRVVQEPGRPDYALCDHCRAAFIMEDGRQMRLYYGQLPENMPRTRQYALKQWRHYADIRAASREEGAQQQPDSLPPDAGAGQYSSNMDAYLALEAQQSEADPQQPNKPRALKDTGELPDLDELFREPGADT